MGERKWTSLSWSASPTAMEAATDDSGCSLSRRTDRGLRCGEKLRLLFSGIPDQAGIIGATLVDRGVPILGIPEPGSKAVHERELGSAGVEVGVHEVCGTDRGKVFRIKQPNHNGRLGYAGKPDGDVVGAGAVKILVQAIMEQVVRQAAAVAPAWVGGTNPD